MREERDSTDIDLARNIIQQYWQQSSRAGSNIGDNIQDLKANLVTGFTNVQLSRNHWKALTIRKDTLTGC